MTTFRYQVREEDQATGKTVKELIATHFKISGRLKKKIKREGLFFISNRPVLNYYRPLAGEILTIQLPEEASDFPPEDIPLAVLYEDPHLLILNKQPGIVVHPTNGNPEHTLANGIMQYMLVSGQRFKIRFINRLDMGTSGVILIGKNSHAQDHITRQMKAGTVEKIYIAILRGIPPHPEGVVDLPIGRPDPEQLQRRVMPEGGAPSVTRYRVLEKLGSGYSLVQLRLETGRTHQIRVHMAHLGHPVLGDFLYGREESALIGRQALHAASLAFAHPVTGEPMKIAAPLPSDITEALERLRRQNALGTC